MGFARWALLLAGAMAVSLDQPAHAQTSAGLDRLLESPLHHRPCEELSWSGADHRLDAASAWHTQQLDWNSRLDDALGTPYGTYYRFGARVPGFYNDHEHRFWSNSYGGPWYYPGSPANTRSGWMDWMPMPEPVELTSI